MSTFTLSIENTPGKGRQYGYHLGTIERLARQMAEEKMKIYRDNDWPVVTMALIRGGKLFDVLYRDGKWHNDHAEDYFDHVAALKRQGLKQDGSPLEA